MTKQIKIWLVGNTGLRNPNRIYEGFKLFANSSFVGRLHGSENESAFMDFLNKSKIINNQEDKDLSASHARKWRLMFAKNGLIYTQVKGKTGSQEELGTLDDITPFGKAFLRAENSYSAIQEFFLRAMSVEQFESLQGNLFSPLRWILALLLEIEKRTGLAEISRIEFALWGQTTDPSYNVSQVVDEILSLRSRRLNSLSKRKFDKEEIEKRGKLYNKKSGNFLDYADMNMRYLRITGLLQKKGRGLMIVPSKHLLATKLAKTSFSTLSLLEQYKILCKGAPLPTDDLAVARTILDKLLEETKEKNIVFDIRQYSLNTPVEVNLVRRKLENLLAQTDEVLYASEQCKQWKEISTYMEVLIHGRDNNYYDDEEDKVVIPKDEQAAYLEWTLWRAALAIDHLINKPYEIRGFNIDSSFMPISTAGGGKGDLYLEFSDFLILTEVTLSTSSRQEAMEGEPVRRHVSDAILKYEKPVFGLFIANKIDTNTAETFRRGIWYTKDDVVQKLLIIPMTLEQFRKFFVALFETNRAHPTELKELLLRCNQKRDDFDAPQWKEYIDTTVVKRIEEMTNELGS